jgi:NADH dehydrogenase (ubiquinone) 1 alpha subcomplex subunit 9
MLTPLQAQGEQVARSIFPETTIVRPAPIFGFEDKLLLRLAHALNLFTANNMQERFSPVHVGFAEALTCRDI